MKSKIKLLYYFLIITFFISCTNERNINETTTLNMYNKTAIENAPQAEKEAYSKFHLLKVARYLDMNFSNKSIDNQILSKGYTNGQSRVIFAKDLINLDYNLSESSESKKSEIEDINKSLHAFENLEGENWQVTVSILNYKSKKLHRIIDETKPIFVLSVDTEKETNTDEVDGYQKNDENIMEKLDSKVNEQVAENNTLYKIGITVLEIRDNNSDGSGGSGGSGGSSGGGNDDWNLGGTNGTGLGTIITPGSSGDILPSQAGLTIRFMRAYNKKESFIESNEIHFDGFKISTFDNSSDVNDLYDISGSSTEGWCGQRIQKFDNADISNGTTFFVNFLINGGSYSSPNSAGGTNSLIYYLIFEHDNYPAPLRQNYFQFSTFSSRIIQYRSYEGLYDSAILWNPLDFFSPNPTAFPSTADNFQVDNGQIKYNLRRTF